MHNENTFPLLQKSIFLCHGGADLQKKTIVTQVEITYVLCGTVRLLLAKTSLLARIM